MRGPDAGGAVDGATGFAGVGGKAEAGGFGFGVDLAEERGGAAGFVSANANADDAGVLGAEFGGFAEDADGFIDAKVADGVDDPEHCGAEVLFATDAAALDGFDEGLDLGLLPEIDDAEGDVDLGVEDALGGKSADHIVGDQLVVFGGAEALGHGLEGHEEAEEVFVGVELTGVGEG